MRDREDRLRTPHIDRKTQGKNHLDGSPIVRVWDQEVCFLCGLRFEPCCCAYDGHWRLTWSLTSGPLRLVEIHASWPDIHHIKLKNKNTRKTVPKKRRERY
jgi:hypothetical protein